MEVKREKEQEEDEKMVMDNSSKQTEPERVRKGKSCKGTLYFSSHLKSKGRNPRCVGITRSLQQVPNYIVSESEVEASKEGRSLTDFKYACVGYSIYMDQNKDAPLDGDQKPRAELPVCVGVEFLVDKRPTDHHAPTPAHNREVGSDSPVGVDLLRGRVLCCMTHGFYGCRKAEMEDRHQYDDHGHHQHRPPKTSHPMGEEFLTRFQRNAGLVASGVARNMRKVGNYVKESIDDILYRRPK